MSDPLLTPDETLRSSRVLFCDADFDLLRSGGRSAPTMSVLPESPGDRRERFRVRWEVRLLALGSTLLVCETHDPSPRAGKGGSPVKSGGPSLITGPRRDNGGDPDVSDVLAQRVSACGACTLSSCGAVPPDGLLCDPEVLTGVGVWNPNASSQGAVVMSAVCKTMRLVLIRLITCGKRGGVSRKQEVFLPSVGVTRNQRPFTPQD